MSELARTRRGLTRWIANADFHDFLIQQVISTFGASLVGIVAVLLLALLGAAVTKNTSGGNFIDHIVEQHVSTLLNQPYYVAPVLCGFIFGVLSRRYFRSRWAFWLWILPMIVLAWNVLTWKGAGPPTTALYWRQVWANYFAADCGSSECLYQAFVTMPLYTAVSYSLGSVLAAFVRRDRFHF